MYPDSILRANIFTVPSFNMDVKKPHHVHGWEGDHLLFEKGKGAGGRDRKLAGKKIAKKNSDNIFTYFF